MRYIVRKFVDAATVAEALVKEPSVPVHEIFAKEGEEPKRNDSPKDLIGFHMETDPQWRRDEAGRK